MMLKILSTGTNVISGKFCKKKKSYGKHVFPFIRLVNEKRKEGRKRRVRGERLKKERKRKRKEEKSKKDLMKFY